MLVRGFLIASLVCLVFTCTLIGKATPTYNDVAVVVNTNSANSMAIGEYFKNARSIPAPNMIYVAVDTSEEIDSTMFNTLRSQVENHLTTNNMVNSINYLVTTKGVPLKVNRGNTFSTISPSASVESELMLILGQYSSYIGGIGKITSPYYFQTAHCTHSAYGIYLVTRLDAYTLQQVLDLVDRSGPGISVSPQASYVFDQDPDWNATIPSLNSYLVTAKTSLEAKGKIVVLDQSTTYMTNRTSVIGYTSWGSNDHYANNYTAYAIPHNTWANGAIAETYVSTSGRSFMMPQTYGQSLVADLIQEGISGVKGYVYEPYSSAMAIPYVLFDRYTSVYNLAESFFMASRYASWMDVIIGDPKTSIDGPPAPLPIQLAHFGATRIQGTDSVKISWGTVSETNNYGFYVQHRDSLSSEFTDIQGSFVPGQGTTLVPQEYSWMHLNVAAGTHYYRLRQIDLDGTVHYTEQVSIIIDVLASVDEHTLPNHLALSQNYPNPFNPTTEIRYENPREGRVALRVFNNLGEEVSTLVDEVQETGTHTVTFSTSGMLAPLASGTYFYRIEIDEQSITKKMILLR
ncbi:MAG: Internalin-related protein [Bacteroidetes bacterium]|nr:Internalin-related protein [Bacteroidota bacterium]